MKKSFIIFSLFICITSNANEIDCQEVESAKMYLETRGNKKSPYYDKVDFNEPIENLNAIGEIRVKEFQNTAEIYIDFEVGIKFKRKLKHAFTNGKMGFDGHFNFREQHSSNNQWFAHLLKSENGIKTYFTTKDAMTGCIFLDCFSKYRGYHIQLFEVKKSGVSVDHVYLGFKDWKNIFKYPSPSKFRELLLAGKAEKSSLQVNFKGCQ